MTIKENNTFKSVEIYNKKISINEILDEQLTGHLKGERKKRFDLAVNLNKHLNNGKQAEIDRIFLIDKNHPDGKELHCVTKKGIIFILNESKYINHTKSFITVLLARPNQVKRLYDECNLTVPKSIMFGAEKNLANKINK